MPFPICHWLLCCCFCCSSLSADLYLSHCFSAKKTVLSCWPHWVYIRLTEIKQSQLCMSVSFFSVKSDTGTTTSSWAHLLLFLNIKHQNLSKAQNRISWFLQMGHNSFSMYLKLTRVDLMPTLSAAWKAKVKFLLCMR